MNRLKPFDIWEHSKEGWPVLNDSEDAIRYAMASYEDEYVHKALPKYRNYLLRYYKLLKQLKKPNLNLMADISFRVQLVNEVMREVVRLRKVSASIAPAKVIPEVLCPFCQRHLLDHSDFNDCPDR